MNPLIELQQQRQLKPTQCARLLGMTYSNYCRLRNNPDKLSDSTRQLLKVLALLSDQQINQLIH